MPPVSGRSAYKRARTPPPSAARLVSLLPATGEIDLGKITLPGVKDCPLSGDRLPLIVISHGRTGSFVVHHDVAEVLADAGFIVAAVNHPGDTASDPGRSEQLAILSSGPITSGA